MSNNFKIRYLFIVLAVAFILITCTATRMYKLEQITLNKDGLEIILKYDDLLGRETWLPETVFLENDKSYPSFKYYKENLVIEDDKEKKEIKIITKPLTDKVNIKKKLYINLKYDLIINIHERYVLAKFIIKKYGSNEIEEIIPKNDMAEYKVNILEAIPIKCDRAASLLYF